ncbi:phosphoribosyltransferase [Acidocella aromatica]|uniref:Putative phosphoribosyl transferase n=1 Tax=Acidocella aromatica TaxID=1303579 RepID=A0A840VIQ5_9PROT|nr:phosphoribosyltransferase [Acidocella aromatica]MBB5373065.1 putative phosphoribosyl transferase [Acidocella aromatica]
MLFTDRADAGKKLAKRLLHLKDEKPMVLALPRGGVPVAFEVAKALAAPLDLVLVRKIGVPFQEEYALGAIADGGEPELVIDEDNRRSLNISEDYVAQAKAEALEEIERRRRVYLGNRAPVEIAGHTAIIVDDGIATGATMRAALRAVRRRNPARLVLAVPVAPPDSLWRLRAEADETICLHEPEHFSAVGQFYQNFGQTQDDEVIALLAQAERNTP